MLRFVYVYFFVHGIFGCEGLRPCAIILSFLFLLTPDMVVVCVCVCLWELRTHDRRVHRSNRAAFFLRLLLLLFLIGDTQEVKLFLFYFSYLVDGVRVPCKEKGPFTGSEARSPTDLRPAEKKEKR